MAGLKALAPKLPYAQGIKAGLICCPNGINMNKVILGLILAVCLLGMALVMLNERLGRQPEDNNAQSSLVAKNRIPPDLDFPETPVDKNPPLPPSSEPAVSPIPNPVDADTAESLEEKEAENALAPLPVPEAPAVNADDVLAQKSRPSVPKAVPPVSKAPEPEKYQPAKPAPEKPLTLEKPAPVGGDKARERTVNRFVIFSREKGATIRIGGTQRIHYNSMTLDNPDRIVVDMDGHWQFPPSPGVPKNEMVSNVRIGKNGDKTRVVIDLKEKARIVRIIPSKNGDSMDIRVDK